VKHSHWPHDTAAQRYGSAADERSPVAPAGMRPLVRPVSASSFATASSATSFASSSKRTLSRRSIGPQKPGSEEEGAHQAEPRVGGLRVPCQGPPILDEGPVGVEGEGSPPLAPSARRA